MKYGIKGRLITVNRNLFLRNWSHVNKNVAFVGFTDLGETIKSDRSKVINTKVMN